MFADDLLLLTKATNQQMELLREALTRFCIASGQKVSKSKTIMFFFPRNILVVEWDVIKSCSRFFVTNNLGCCLGVSLLHGRVSK